VALQGITPVRIKDPTGGTRNKQWMGAVFATLKQAAAAASELRATRVALPLGIPRFRSAAVKYLVATQSLFDLSPATPDTPTRATASPEVDTDIPDRSYKQLISFKGALGAQDWWKANRIATTFGSDDTPAVAVEGHEEEIAAQYPQPPPEEAEKVNLFDTTGDVELFVRVLGEVRDLAITLEDVMEFLKSRPKGKSPGLSGWRYEYLRAIVAEVLKKEQAE
jgi:hypothetical protein